MQKIWLIEKEKLLEHYKSGEDGLTDEDVERRLKEYGENRLQEKKRKSIMRVFLEQFQDLLVWILLAAAAVSALTGGIEGSVVILLVLLLNAVLGTVQHTKAQNSLDSLKAMSAPTARVIRNGEKKDIPAAAVVPGDILLLEAGDVAAADGRILKNYSLQVNESALTGESENVDKADIVLHKADLPPGDRINMIYSGSLVAYGRAVVLVTATGTQTEIGNIAHLMETAQEQQTPLQRSLHRFSKNLSLAVILICVLVFGLSMWRGMVLTDALMFAVALAVAAIPEALGSIVTIGLAIGTQKMAKENAIIKELKSVESLGSVSVICSDKTGTLTQNQMTVQSLYVSEQTIDADSAVRDRNMQKLIEMSVLCNDAVYHGDKPLGDPTETALLDFCRKWGMSEAAIRSQYPRLEELPFDSERKMMSTLHKIGDTYRLLTKGAPDVLLSRCSYIYMASGMQQCTEEEKNAVKKQIAVFSAKGLRVLAFAEKDMPEQRQLHFEDEENLTFIGLIAMMDPPREETAKAVADCCRAGIRPVMITGDHKVTAAAIAEKIGILQKTDRVVDGAELEQMTDEQLQSDVSQISVYARVSPEHKIRIVKAWQKQGAITAMTGDGVNDAPALKQADIGIAMGITGTSVSKDAAAMILTDDNFATIVKAVSNGRAVYQNIRHSIQFLLSGNLAGILVVLYTSILGLPLPFTAVQLLFINLVTDSLPALAINMEPPEDNLLNRKPRDPQEGILTGEFLKQLAAQGLLLAIVTLIGYYAGYIINDGLAGTMAFAVLCLARLFHGFNCRGENSLFRLPANWYSIAAFVLGGLLLLAVLLIPGLHEVFAVSAEFTSDKLFMVLLFAALPTVLIQLYRIIRMR